MISDGGNQTIVFGELELSKEVIISALADDLGEGDEVIVLNLITDVAGNDINIESDLNQTRITIIEDDCECS